MGELKNLDALANQLYLEGMEKAKKESDQLLADAEKKKTELLSEAEKEAQQIVSKAKSKAEKLQHAAQAEIRQKGLQAKQDLMDQIKRLIAAKLSKDPIREALSDVKLVEKMMLAALETWKKGEELEISVGQILEQHLPDIKRKVHRTLPDARVMVRDDIHTGFIIEATKSGYRLSFTESDFEAFFTPYLSKTIAEILFEADE